MARIVDPDQLNLNVEVSFDYSDPNNRLIELHVGAGNLTQEGVTLQALYSACKEFWQTDADLIKIPFPFEAITEVKFDLFNNWDFSADALKDPGDKTKELIRDGGWSKMDAGVAQEQYFGFVTLGLMDDSDSDLAYFIQEEAGSVSSVIYTGPVNEPVKIYGDESHGSVDYRSMFQSFLREQAKTYASATLADQNVFNIDYTVYKLPLANAPDPKVDATDNQIETLPVYENMTISYLRGQGFTDWVSEAAYSIDDVVKDTTLGVPRWYRALTNHSGVATAPNLDTTNWETYLGERQIRPDLWYPYNIIVDGDGQLAEYIYEFTQYKNRQGVDINDDAYTEAYGSVVGQIAPQFLRFLGDTLITGTGVFIENFAADDTNRIEFTDTIGAIRTYLFVAAGRINFNDHLQADANAKYWMFFTDGFGTDSAIIVEDAEGNPITGSIGGVGFKNWSFDYDGNDQGGRTPATDAPVTVVGIGLDRAQYVVVEGTIGREVGQTFTLVAALERNYISGS